MRDQVELFQILEGVHEQNLVQVLLAKKILAGKSQLIAINRKIK